MTACPECGYDFESLDRPQILRELTGLAAQQRQLLESVPAGLLRAHPRPGSWSALEYGCHVRDVLGFQRARVLQAQAEEVPCFTSMRRDERAVEERYNDQDPRAVAGQLAAAARDFAATLSALDEAGWLRTGSYPWPVPAVRSVEWIGQRTVHELAHHLFDCRRLLAATPD
jgi:DinB superfamily